MIEFFGRRTYAQQGDDIVLSCIFLQFGLQTPSYLDLGAYHPIDGSNTHLFYTRGSRGINVEANPELLGEFRARRPHDVNLNCGVAAARGRAALRYLAGHGGTFRPDWPQAAATNAEIAVDLFTVADIVGHHAHGAFPDLLNIDIEGMDAEVLASIDFASGAPMVIDVEAFCGTPEASAIRATLEAAGFFFLMRCGHNALFVRNDLRDQMF